MTLTEEQRRRIQVIIEDELITYRHVHYAAADEAAKKILALIEQIPEEYDWGKLLLADNVTIQRLKGTIRRLVGCTLSIGPCSEVGKKCKSCPDRAEKEIAHRTI